VSISLTPLNKAEFAVHDRGERIGKLRATHGGRAGRVFWLALARDSADLGAFADQGDAVRAIVEDNNNNGNPRSPRDHRERWRPMFDGPTAAFPNGASTRHIAQPPLESH